MNLDSLIPFWMKHNATIIESLIGLSLLITAFLSIRSFLSAKNPSAFSSDGLGIDATQLEKTLKQLLERAGQVPSVAAAGNSQSSSAATGVGSVGGAGGASAGGGNSEDGAKLLIKYQFRRYAAIDAADDRGEWRLITGGRLDLRPQIAIDGLSVYNTRIPVL